MFTLPNDISIRGGVSWDKKVRSVSRREFLKKSAAGLLGMGLVSVSMDSLFQQDIATERGSWFAVYCPCRPYPPSSSCLSFCTGDLAFLY